jgi:uncharacterized paraquat-inducible protein A
MAQWRAFVRKYVGICSKHMRKRDPNRKLYQTDIREVIPNYDQLVSDAQAAGERTCHRCQFVHYRTTDRCPKCGSIQVT